MWLKGKIQRLGLGQIDGLTIRCSYSSPRPWSWVAIQVLWLTASPNSSPSRSGIFLLAFVGTRTPMHACVIKNKNPKSKNLKMSAERLTPPSSEGSAWSMALLVCACHLCPAQLALPPSVMRVLSRCPRFFASRGVVILRMGIGPRAPLQSCWHLLLVPYPV